METEIHVKYLTSDNMAEELREIGFDRAYIAQGAEKNISKTLKLFNLKPQEAAVLKQSALSLGFDCCVNRGVIDCSVEFSDCIITGSLSHFRKLAKKLIKQPFRLKQISCEIERILFTKQFPLIISDTVFDWSRPYIMGILNLTPDSFSDGGKFLKIDNAIKHFNELLDEGADIIDIGAESTKPAHTPITSDEEIKRLEPVLKEIRNINKSAIISVDTRNAKTAQKAVELGANIINDVSTGMRDKKMIEFVNANNIPYILTHSLDTGSNAVEETYFGLKKIIEKLTTDVIVDVGIGFGKTADGNFELINKISEFKSLGKPVLVGHSRKSFLSKSFDLAQDELDFATQIVTSYLVQNSVNIIRTHEVKKQKLLIDILAKIKSSSS